MPWSTRFFDPIPLPGGLTLLTLKDAGEYIQALPAAVQKTETLAGGDEALLIVVKSGDPMLARIGMMPALYPRGTPVFDKSRNDPRWGKRKLKRDQCMSSCMQSATRCLQNGLAAT